MSQRLPLSFIFSRQVGHDKKLNDLGGENPCLKTCTLKGQRTSYLTETHPCRGAHMTDGRGAARTVRICSPQEALSFFLILCGLVRSLFGGGAAEDPA